MPIYNYKCTKCEAEFEKIMSMSARIDKKNLVACPECGCVDVISLLSKSSFTLKGGGWYKDGYQKGEKNEAG